MRYSHGVTYLHETVKANKMCLNETRNRVWLGRHLSDMFPIKNCL